MIVGLPLSRLGMRAYFPSGENTTLMGQAPIFHKTLTEWRQSAESGCPLYYE